MLRIVQFSDTHLTSKIGDTFYGVDTFLALKRAFERSMSLKIPPDIFFVTGDLSEDGMADSYEHFKAIFRDSLPPVFLVPGNHDQLPVMLEVFQDTNIQLTFHTIINNWNCIFLDS